MEIQELQDLCFTRATEAGWHSNLITGEPNPINPGLKMMLIVSEIAEAFEGERKNLMDDHLPHRKMAEVELADCIIRILDYAGLKGYDIQGAITEKMEYNLNRADHKIENRLKDNGKRF